MPRNELISVEALRTKLTTRYRNQHREWFSGADVWPMSFSLGLPSEATAIADMEAVRAWSESWLQWPGSGRIEVESRSWGTLGRQELPARIVFSRPAEIAAVVGEVLRWETAIRRRGQVLQQWPTTASVLHRHFDDLADYAEGDWARLLAVLEWLLANRRSNLYPRQLPIHGIDSKWIEGRLALIRSLLGACAEIAIGDLFEEWGLRRPPAMVRLIVLDDSLRSVIGGWRELMLPSDAVAALSWQPRKVLIIENVQTALSLPDAPGVVAIVGLGYRVDVIGRWPWLLASSCVYWGDIDTDGFAILARARRHQPQLSSVLMDVATVECHRDLLGTGDGGSGAPDVTRLAADERMVFEGLKAGRWGVGARLEQERIDWNYVLTTLSPALAL